MTAPRVLREYGQAIRGDWAELDGRSVRSTLDDIAHWIEEPDDYPGDETARRILGICVTGGGHWCGSYHGYCNDLYDCGCPDDPKKVSA